PMTLSLKGRCSLCKPDESISFRTLPPATGAARTEDLHAHFYNALPAGMFVTMFCGMLDLEDRKLVYASAGHDPPLVVRGAGVERLTPTAPVLGLLPELRDGIGSTTLQPGEMLLLYTDGLTTARWRGDERVEEDRLAEWLRESDRLSPQALLTELLHRAGTE